MNEFSDMEDIVEKIKDVICHEIDGKVFDQDVAKVLEIDRGVLALRKKRNSVPHTEVFRFCRKYKVSIESMIFKNSTVSS